MADRLRSRLARLRSSRETSDESPGPAGRVVRAPSDIPPGDPLRGWSQAGDFTWTRETRVAVSLPEFLDLRPFSRFADGYDRVPAGALAFFDLETTGLSGGAGTVAFLASFGSVREGRLLIRQYFLEDYPGERVFLDAALAEIPSDGCLVSYNGKAFDVPLLRTRCVMNGLRFAAPRHVDLVHPARRLWKRLLPDCSLGTIEREILGIDRGPDVPGCEVPGIWLDFVKRKAAGRLPLVFSHNASDVSTLASLLSAALGLLEGGRSPAADPEGLARLAERSDPRKAMGILKLAGLAGNDTVARHYYRLARAWGSDDEILEGLDALPLDVSGLVARSRHAEWKAREPETALGHAERAMALAREEPESGLKWGLALEKRISRLRKKITGRN